MQYSKPHISVVTPAYRCAQSIPELYERLKKTLDEITNNWEIIIVNDCSPENDWKLHIYRSCRKFVSMLLPHLPKNRAHVELFFSFSSENLFLFNEGNKHF